MTSTCYQTLVNKNDLCFPSAWAVKYAFWMFARPKSSKGIVSAILTLSWEITLVFVSESWVLVTSWSHIVLSSSSTSSLVENCQIILLTLGCTTVVQYWTAFKSYSTIIVWPWLSSTKKQWTIQYSSTVLLSCAEKTFTCTWLWMQRAQRRPNPLGTKLSLRQKSIPWSTRWKGVYECTVSFTVL